MITVWVDRGSVAMGDDVESHEVAWEFEDHACAGDVLLRALDTRYLPWVAAEVSWTLQVGEFAVRPRRGYTSVTALSSAAAAVVNIPHGSSPRILTLDTRLLLTPFASRPEWAGRQGEFGVEFQYSSGATLISPDELREQLQQGEHRRHGIVARARKD